MRRLSYICCTAVAPLVTLALKYKHPPFIHSQMERKTLTIIITETPFPPGYLDVHRASATVTSIMDLVLLVCRRGETHQMVPQTVQCDNTCHLVSDTGILYTFMCFLQQKQGGFYRHIPWKCRRHVLRTSFADAALHYIYSTPPDATNQ